MSVPRKHKTIITQSHCPIFGNYEQARYQSAILQRGYFFARLASDISIGT